MTTVTTRNKRMTIAPRLISAADCRLDLDFSPNAVWPELLPGIAVNGFAWAGFRQPYFLDHTIDLTTIPSRFRELHPDLSFVELARLARAAEPFEQFPFEAVYGIYFGELTETVWTLIFTVAELPPALANWAQERRLGPNDLFPLVKLAREMPNALVGAADVFAELQRLEVPRSEGKGALELLADLLVEGRSLDELRALEEDTGADWLLRLRLLRHPTIHTLLAGEEDIDRQITGLQRRKEELRRVFWGTD